MGGCLGSGEPKPNLSLPASPDAFGQPVVAPAIKQGDDVRVFAAQESAALAQANGRLTDDRAFYDDVRKRIGQ